MIKIKFTNRLDSFTYFEEIQALLLTVELQTNLIEKTQLLYDEEKQLRLTRACALNKIWSMLDLRQKLEYVAEEPKTPEPKTPEPKPDKVKFLPITSIHIPYKGEMTPIKWLANPYQMRAIGKRINTLYKQKYPNDKVVKDYDNGTLYNLYPVKDLVTWITDLVRNEFFDSEGHYIYKTKPN